MNTETQTVQTSEDILSESFISYEYATRGQRFLNFLIDYLLMNYGLSFLTGMLMGILLEAVSPQFLERMAIPFTSEFWIFSLLVGYFNFIVYYTLCEKLFVGRTLGKLITGTMAVKIDGSPLTFKDAFLRSLCRIVPFEALSGFGVPWHDSWTNTTVIKTR
jgi:uncharacterized RDD family membrane protein YckC